jgi:nucleoside-diphosphate-sugar epimerase
VKVLVTGGTTWFGQHIVQRLALRGHEVVALDEHPAPWRLPLPRPVPVHPGAATDVATLLPLLRTERPEAIVNRHVLYGPETETAWLRTVQVNLVGALQLFEAAALAGVPRVVYESSIGVYGRQEEHGPAPLTEEDDLFARPPHVYRLTQHAVEFFARRYRAATGVALVGSRPSVCHSPLKDVGISRWSNDFVTLPVLGRPMRFPHVATQRTSLIWVDDAADVVVRLVEAPRLRHDMYNSGGHDVSNAELAAMVQALIPGAAFSFSDSETQPLAHRIDRRRAREDLGLELLPLAETLREHAELARRLHGLPPLPR